MPYQAEQFAAILAENFPKIITKRKAKKHDYQDS